MPGQKKDRIRHGEDGDPYYVSDNERRCAGKCENILPLSWFYPIIKESGTHVTVFCKACLPEVANTFVEQEKTQIAVTRTKAIRDMGDALKKILHKPVTREEGPSVVQLASLTIQAVVDPTTKKVGQEAFADMIGREIAQVYENPSPCIRTRVLRHKWAGLVMDMQTVVAKLKEEEIKVGDLSDEQVAALLEFASKQIVLESEEIRTALLDDPEIRAALMADMNKQVIEVPATTPEA